MGVSLRNYSLSYSGCNEAFYRNMRPREFLDLTDNEPLKRTDDILEINCSEVGKDDESSNILLKITRQEYTDNIHRVKI